MGGGGGGGAAWTVLQLDQPVTLVVLRRHKRDFLKLSTKLLHSRLSDAGAARRMFVDYLLEHLPGASRLPSSWC